MKRELHAQAEAFQLSDNVKAFLEDSGDACSLYVFSISGHPGLLKPGISDDLARRASESQGLYGDLLLECPRGNRAEAWALEQAILRETRARHHLPAELKGWDGQTELRRMDPAELEQVALHYVDELERLGLWAFMADYVALSDGERRACEERATDQREEQTMRGRMEAILQPSLSEQVGG